MLQVLLLAGAAIFGLLTGCAKLTLLNGYRVEQYLDAGRPRTMYWTARAASVCAGLCIAAFGAATRLWWVAFPCALFFAFAVSVNVRAIRMRLSGKYRQFYAERGWQ